MLQLPRLATCFVLCAYAWGVAGAALVAASAASAAASDDKYVDRDEQEVEAAMGQREPEFRSCYDDQLIHYKDLNKMSGEVITFFVIRKDGSVSQAKVLSTSLHQARVEACLIRTIQTIRFSNRGTRGPTEVTYPFKFLMSRTW